MPWSTWAIMAILRKFMKSQIQRSTRAPRCGRIAHGYDTRISTGIRGRKANPPPTYGGPFRNCSITYTNWIDLETGAKPLQTGPGIALVNLETLAVLGAGAGIAGFVDTLAGGGGLITVPLLLLTGLPPLQALSPTSCRVRSEPCRRRRRLVAEGADFYRRGRTGVGRRLRRRPSRARWRRQNRQRWRSGYPDPDHIWR